MSGTAPISLKELARMANVSTATISRVINNNGRFSEETRRRVMALIKETGYSPNIAAKALRTKTARAVGLIIPEVGNQFFSQIVDALGRVCFTKDYSLFVCSTDEDPEKNQAIIASLLGKGVDGLVYISRFPLVVSDPGIPVVFLDRVPRDGSALAAVESDNYQGGRLAAEALLRAGSREPVVLCAPDDLGVLSTIAGRLEGFEDGMRIGGVPWAQRTGILKVPMKIPGVRDKVAKAVRAGRRFDGLFSTLDIGAIGAMLGLEDVGLRVPEDVNVVGFDDIPLGEFWRPPLTTVRQDVTALAMMGAKLLFDIMGKKTFEQEHVTIPVELVTRASTR